MPKYLDIQGVPETAPGALLHTMPKIVRPIYRFCPIVFCGGFTPAGTGADTEEIEVPWVGDGSLRILWTVVRFSLRVATAGGAPSVNLEVSSSQGSFSPTFVTGVALKSGANFAAQAGKLGTVQSGQFLRFNVAVLGTATGWTIQTLLRSQQIAVGAQS